MTDTIPPLRAEYPFEDGKVTIRIPLATPDQIFTGFSPVPFNPRGLTAETEEYITATVRDLPAGTPFRIVFSLPGDKAGLHESREIPGHVRTHYQYSCLVLDRKYRQWTQMGKKYAVLALALLAICSFLSQAVVMNFGETLPVKMISDAFTILGWAAVWAPATVLLEELWPIRGMKKTCEAIIAAEIIVRSE